LGESHSTNGSRCTKNVHSGSLLFVFFVFVVLLFVVLLFGVDGLNFCLGVVVVLNCISKSDVMIGGDNIWAQCMPCFG